MLASIPYPTRGEQPSPEGERILCTGPPSCCRLDDVYGSLRIQAPSSREARFLGPPTRIGTLPGQETEFCPPLVEYDTHCQSESEMDLVSTSGWLECDVVAVNVTKIFDKY